MVIPDYKSDIRSFSYKKLIFMAKNGFCGCVYQRDVFGRYYGDCMNTFCMGCSFCLKDAISRKNLIEYFSNVNFGDKSFSMFRKD